jgi:histidinol dehydrogenase
MGRLLNINDPEFGAQFDGLLGARGEGIDRAIPGTMKILADVKDRGFQAVADATQAFDSIEVSADSARIPLSEAEAAWDSLDPDLKGALQLAADRIRAFHKSELPEDSFRADAVGIKVGWRWTPVDAAGLYAPGGKAAYPSSVLMNAIPAEVAGVQRRVMVTPPGRLKDNPAILAAAHIAGVTEIWGIGGAQAIGALAYGADPIAPVDVIVGPGNAYVAAAKRLVFGTVGIDSVAGPSEVVIVADRTANAEWLAMDLLAQAEHDEDAQSILITPSADLASAVMAAVSDALEQGKAGAPAAASWASHGGVVAVNDLDEALGLVDRIAPEHLQLAMLAPHSFGAKVRHAGAIFYGHHTPEALGDYLAGPNHVLPTGARSRFSSGLSTLNFMKRTTLIEADERSLPVVGPAAAILADHEGLPAHAGSLRVRLNQTGDA